MIDNHSSVYCEGLSGASCQEPAGLRAPHSGFSCSTEPLKRAGGPDTAAGTGPLPDPLPEPVCQYTTYRDGDPVVRVCYCSTTRNSSAEEPQAEALLSTLSRQQVTTVRKRLDNYTETLRKRNRQPIRDVHDLSSCDLRRLGFITHIELSTFLLPLGVQTKRTRPPRRSSRDGGVFGVPLDALLHNDRKSSAGVKVPIVFQKLLCILEQSGLQTEGILRVPGSAARLKYLRRELDRCSGRFDWSAVRQVDAAGLLKLFIRELPTPLLTHTHLSTYLAVLGVSSLVHQVQALQLLTLLLPESNRDTLRALLVFLRKVVSHQDQNRMSLWNVSMVVAPNLFACRHRGNKRSITMQQEEMEEAVGGAHLVQLMITHQDLLWTVPAFLLSQVRQMNQVSNQKEGGLGKTTRRLLKRINDKNDGNLVIQVTELSAGVIRVHAPLNTKVSMAIQLDGQTTAKDVIARFKCEKR
ncbi:rho GTPase-activating protein 28 [Scomber scombrus]|uniref:Rho GTPase-activating protein 28 n=1 Tax=Scomber scombrus TaxID=13677 RepID=A0AAV1Q6A7_SCOSC